jgi:hypothetical protein
VVALEKVEKKNSGTLFGSSIASIQKSAGSEVLYLVYFSLFFKEKKLSHLQTAPMVYVAYNHTVLTGYLLTHLSQDKKFSKFQKEKK